MKIDRETEMQSFVFYDSFWKALKRIENEGERCNLYDAICAYIFECEYPENLTNENMSLFELIQPQLDANIKRAINGGKGGRPKKEKTIGFENEKPNKNINKNENKNLNLNKNENENSCSNSYKGEKEHIKKDSIPKETIQEIFDGVFSVFENELMISEKDRQEKNAYFEKFTMIVEYGKIGLAEFVPRAQEHVKNYGVHASLDVFLEILSFDAKK
ncbi:MAG: hypothetical protein IJX99_01370 [Clostridia bacterium]|nr:hypothetical protein [Clostridia bacterium]